MLELPNTAGGGGAEHKRKMSKAPSMEPGPVADTLASLLFELWFLLRKCRPDLEGDFREISLRPALP